MRTSLLSALCLLFAAGPSLAASDRIRTSSSAHEHHSSGDMAMAFGISDTQTITNGESLTGLFGVGDTTL